MNIPEAGRQLEAVQGSVVLTFSHVRGSKSAEMK